MNITAEMVKELREKTGAGMMDCKKALSETKGNMEEAVDWLREKGIAKSEKKQSRIAAEGLAKVFVKNNKAVILEVNSETDFVSKNEEFTKMIDDIGATILDSDAKNLEEVLNLSFGDATIKDLIVAKVAKIGEKLELRRVNIAHKSDDEVFGSYLHLGGRIAVLTILKGANESIAKEVAMQAAAMRPLYVFEADVPQSVLDKERSVQKELAMSEGKPADIAEKMVDGRIKKYLKEICLEHQAFIKDNAISVKEYVKNNNGEIVNMYRYEVGEGIEKKEENFAEEVMNQIKDN